jgi:hypothetical protein
MATWARTRTNGTWRDYPDTSTPIRAQDTENWDDGLDQIYNTGATLSGPLTLSHSGVTDKPLYVEHAQTTGSQSNYKPVQLYAEYKATDPASAFTNVYHGLSSTWLYGGSGTPTESIGSGHTITSELVVRGAGSQSNEYSTLFAALRADLGTGYTSPSTTPGRYWGSDQSVHGPIDVQPGLLNGITMLVNNHYNGSPSSQPSAAGWFVTRNGSGGGLDATHTAAETYALDVGVGIVGTSAVGNTGRGFTVALKVGGVGSGWASGSRFGTGIEVRDWEDFGVYVSNRYSGGTGPALAVASGAGPVVIGGTAPASSVTLLEVVTGSGTKDPLVTFRSTATSAISFTFQNASGGEQMFTAGGADSFIPGTAAGDSGIKVLGAAKKWHIGGSSIVQTVTQDGKVGWFGVTPVVQQTLPSAGTVTASDIRTALITLGLCA